MTYHSKFNGQEGEKACEVTLYPFEQKGAYVVGQPEAHDIVDEAIYQYRANIMFKSYRVQGDGDKVVIYLTSFIQCVLDHMRDNQDKAKIV